MFRVDLKIYVSPQFAQWLTLLFELFDGDVVGRIDYLTRHCL